MAEEPLNDEVILSELSDEDLTAQMLSLIHI